MDLRCFLKLAKIVLCGEVNGGRREREKGKSAARAMRVTTKQTCQAGTEPGQAAPIHTQTQSCVRTDPGTTLSQLPFFGFQIAYDVKMLHYCTVPFPIQNSCQCCFQSLSHSIQPPDKSDTNVDASLSHAHVFEPIRSAILFHQPRFAIGKSSSHTTFAFWRVRAVEIGNVLIANISEPDLYKC